MLNLENLGVLELNAQEKETIEGGFLEWLLIVLIIVVVGIAFEGGFNKQ